jgi:acyl-CoA reductase-like NAD-dependent aldehyde dehydrogenase
LLIQKSIKATFLPILIEKIAALRIGDPLDSETDFGAVVSGAHRQKVVDFISLGRAEGANLVFQSNAAFPFEEGYYVAPTVFDGVTSKQRLAQDEIFGPVLSVLTFKDEDEAISIANGTIYGLSAILWTTDIGRAHRLTQAIKAGWIIVNATANPANGADSVIPTGGHKQSGFGVEGGIDGLRGYTNQTTVQINV